MGLLGNCGKCNCQHADPCYEEYSAEEAEVKAAAEDGVREALRAKFVCMVCDEEDYAGYGFCNGCGSRDQFEEME